MAQQVIDRFVVIAELGRGGMATVFHAYDPDFDRPVAIKVMPREFLHVPDFKARFQREARIIANLEHNAIVPVYELGVYDDLPYLVMRYMPGGSLSDRIAHEPLALPEVIHLFSLIAPAIDFAHAQGFVHRDLKPDNILFDQHDNAFIADFGIAKLMHSTSQLTGSGALVGTPAYMSPEQIMEQGEIDHRSDLYSLGVILYEVLTGQMPFLVESAHAYYSAHLNNPVPDIRDARPDLPPLFSSIIYKAMAKDKDERYQSAADLAADVARALDTDAVDHEFESPVVSASPTRPVPYALIGGAAFLVLVLAALLLSGVLGGAGEPEQVVVQITATSQSVSAEQPSDSPTPTTEQTVDPELPNDKDGWIVFDSDRDDNREIYKIRADGDSLTRLTLNDVDDYNPSWSPDGTRIAFVSERDGNPEIYVMDSDGGNPVRLTENEALDDQPSWSPDGSQIAFSSERDGNREIYTMESSGQNIVRLTNTSSAREEEPDWSPDGLSIVYSRSGSTRVDVWIMNADGSDAVSLTSSVGASAWAPVWSPDGMQIAFTLQLESQEQLEVAILNINSSESTIVTSEVYVSLVIWSAWSPDGKWIAYDELRNATGDHNIVIRSLESDFKATLVSHSSDNQNPDWWAPPDAEAESEPEADSAAEDIDLRTAGWIVYSYASNIDLEVKATPIYNLYTMRADGEERTRLTVTDGRDENPAWSPDGTRIAFNSDRDGNKEIYVMDANGLNQTRLTFSDGLDFGPRWSPDGSQIVFTSDRDGNLEIYVMNADGSNQTRLTDSDARDHWPDWSPDGEQIVFSSSRTGSIERIFIMNADGSDLSPPLNQPDIYADIYPRWSPDGRTIVFKQEYGMFDIDRSCVSEVSVGDTLLIDLVDPGGEPILVATCFDWAAWSPNGQFLVGRVWWPSSVAHHNFEVFALPGETRDPNQFIAQITDVTLDDTVTWPDWWAPPSDS